MMFDVGVGRPCSSCILYDGMDGAMRDDTYIAIVKSDMYLQASDLAAREPASGR